MLANISNYIMSFFYSSYEDNSLQTSNSYFTKIQNYPNRFYYLSLLEKEDEYGNMQWHIHGLWPQYNINSYPSFCRDVTFDLNELRTILPDLQKYWYSTESTNQQFWEHEWKKHGSCMFNKMDEFDYFNTALKLFTNAIEQDLPQKYYDEKTQKCLIPVSTDLKFIG